ncbi:hypothetical protein NNJEOMEG_03352 [Fundidesulfovibrio magnetotacticus]|uniref:Uncharacterized protein n=1 Tax=Fundidesulfovibrio magnetotacticus TaxID=2730080 RepID=A0A6V8M0V8_9BACT|nr:hypothetical protein [Fundidesulfovibrio magnetotacticus]GFK95487.1 hypothetical protein NNJEOMEG_03352 [Fundidesulfovibrio magnetotacticus]
MTLFTRLSLAAALLVLLAPAALAAQKAQPPAAKAQALARGFGQAAWGEDLSRREGFLKLRSQDGVDYAVYLRENFQLGGAKATVYYASAGGRFYAAHVRLPAGSDLKALSVDLTKLFGASKSSRQDGMPLHQWKTGKVRVKLKELPGGEARLSFYHQSAAGPLTAALRDADLPAGDLPAPVAGDVAGVKSPSPGMPKPQPDQVPIDVLYYLKEGSQLLRLEKPSGY